MHVTEVPTVKECVAGHVRLPCVNDNPGKSPLLAMWTLCFQNFKENFECYHLALKISLSFLKGGFAQLCFYRIKVVGLF